MSKKISPIKVHCRPDKKEEQLRRMEELRGACIKLPYTLFAPQWALDALRDRIGMDKSEQLGIEYLLSLFVCGIAKNAANCGENDFHNTIGAALAILFGGIQFADGNGDDDDDLDGDVDPDAILLKGGDAGGNKTIH